MARDIVDFRDLTAQIAKARGSTDPDRAWAAFQTYASTGQIGVLQTLEQFKAF